MTSDSWWQSCRDDVRRTAEVFTSDAERDVHLIWSQDVTSRVTELVSWRHQCSCLMRFSRYTSVTMMDTSGSESEDFDSDEGSCQDNADFLVSSICILTLSTHTFGMELFFCAHPHPFPHFGRAVTGSWLSLAINDLPSLPSVFSHLFRFFFLPSFLSYFFSLTLCLFSLFCCSYCSLVLCIM